MKRPDPVSVLMVGTVLIVLAIVLFGVWAVIRISSFQDQCEAKGGVVINSRTGSICVDADAVLR